MDYAKLGSLRENLHSVVQMKWETKLNLLHCIALDLEAIHYQDLIHKDLHSGNVLQVSLHSAYVADLGLSSSEKKKLLCTTLYCHGILQGQEFTQAADTYGFGVIMTEIATGQRPFDGFDFGNDLVMKIRDDGLRPNFASSTPINWGQNVWIPIRGNVLILVMLSWQSILDHSNKF